MRKIRPTKYSRIPLCTRLGAALVCLTLLPGPSTLPLYAADTAAISMLQDFESIQIPSGLGSVEEVFHGSPETAVILLEDAHAVPEAQKSLRDLLLFLEKNNGLRGIGVEGVLSRLDLNLLRSYPEKDEARKFFNRCLEQGELPGASAAALSEESRAEYFGVEDWNVYEQGLHLYQESLENQSRFTEKISKLRDAMDQKKKLSYSATLLQVDKALSAFERNHEDLAGLLRTLSSFHNPPAGSDLETVWNEINRETTQPEALNTALRREAERFKEALESGAYPRQTQASFYETFQKYQTSQLSPEAFALFLREFSALSGLVLENSEQIEKAALQGRKLRDLEGSRFFESLEAYAGAVKDTLFQNEAQKQLDRKSRRLDLLERLVRLELSPQEWQEWIAGGQDPVFEDASFLAAPSAFYRNALQRDEIFLEKLTAKMSQRGEKVSALVAGGFHARGLTELLRARNISYMRVRPAISRIPETSAYQAQMQGRMSWTSYFRQEGGRISLFKAFMRYSRDELLKTSKASRGVLLKQWRDQLIRDLAQQNRIENTSSYTAFIDEAAGEGALAWHPEWLKKVQSLALGLRQLNASGRVTEQSVIRLISLSRTQTLVAASGDPLAFASPDLLAMAAGAERTELRTIEVGDATARLRAREKNVMSGRLRSRFEAIARLPGQKHRLLDLGTGNGELIAPSVRRSDRTLIFDEVTGVDLDKARLQQFRKINNFPGLDLLHGDFMDVTESLQAEGQRFNAILLAFSVNFIPMADRDRLFERLIKMTAPGGRILFVVNGKERLPSNQVRVRDELMTKHRVTAVDAKTNFENIFQEWGHLVEVEPVHIVHETADRDEMIRLVAAVLPRDDRDERRVSAYVDRNLFIKERGVYHFEIDEDIIQITPQKKESTPKPPTGHRLIRDAVEAVTASGQPYSLIRAGGQLYSRAGSGAAVLLEDNPLKTHVLSMFEKLSQVSSHEIEEIYFPAGISGEPLGLALQQLLAGRSAFEHKKLTIQSVQTVFDDNDMIAIAGGDDRLLEQLLDKGGLLASVQVALPEPRSELRVAREDEAFVRGFASSTIENLQLFMDALDALINDHAEEVGLLPRINFGRELPKKILSGLDGETAAEQMEQILDLPSSEAVFDALKAAFYFEGEADEMALRNPELVTLVRRQLTGAFLADSDDDEPLKLKSDTEFITDGTGRLVPVEIKLVWPRNGHEIILRIKKDQKPDPRKPVAGRISLEEGWSYTVRVSGELIRTGGIAITPEALDKGPYLLSEAEVALGLSPGEYAGLQAGLKRWFEGLINTPLTSRNPQLRAEMRNWHALVLAGLSLIAGGAAVEIFHHQTTAQSSSKRPVAFYDSYLDQVAKEGYSYGPSYDRKVRPWSIGQRKSAADALLKAMAAGEVRGGDYPLIQRTLEEAASASRRRMESVVFDKDIDKLAGKIEKMRKDGAKVSEDEDALKIAEEITDLYLGRIQGELDLQRKLAKGILATGVDKDTVKSYLENAARASIYRSQSDHFEKFLYKRYFHADPTDAQMARVQAAFRQARMAQLADLKTAAKTISGQLDRAELALEARKEKVKELETVFKDAGEKSEGYAKQLADVRAKLKGESLSDGGLLGQREALVQKQKEHEREKQYAKVRSVEREIVALDKQIREARREEESFKDSKSREDERARKARLDLFTARGEVSSTASDVKILGVVLDESYDLIEEYEAAQRKVKEKRPEMRVSTGLLALALWAGFGGGAAVTLLDTTAARAQEEKRARAYYDLYLDQISKEGYASGTGFDRKTLPWTLAQRQQAVASLLKAREAGDLRFSDYDRVIRALEEGASASRERMERILFDAGIKKLTGQIAQLRKDGVDVTTDEKAAEIAVEITDLYLQKISGELRLQREIGKAILVIGGDDSEMWTKFLAVAARSRVMKGQTDAFEKHLYSQYLLADPKDKQLERVKNAFQDSRFISIAELENMPKKISAQYTRAEKARDDAADKVTRLEADLKDAETKSSDYDKQLLAVRRKLKGESLSDGGLQGELKALRDKQREHERNKQYKDARALEKDITDVSKKVRDAEREESNLKDSKDREDLKAKKTRQDLSDARSLVKGHETRVKTLEALHEEVTSLIEERKEAAKKKKSELRAAPGVPIYFTEQQLREVAAFTAETPRELLVHKRYTSLYVIQGKYGKYILKKASEGESFGEPYMHNEAGVIQEILEAYRARQAGSLPIPQHVHMRLGIWQEALGGLVTPYLEGDNAYDWFIDQGRTFKNQYQYFTVSLQIAGTVSFLHTLGFAHRDLKLDNFFVTPSPFLVANLIDFNLAFNPASSRPVLRGGTAGYAPPEQLGEFGHAEITTRDIADYQRQDVYSLGVTLLRLWLGGYAGNEQATDLHFTEMAPEQILETLDFKDVPIKDILAKALNPNPALRYASAVEMEHDIRDRMVRVRQSLWKEPVQRRPEAFPSALERQVTLVSGEIPLPAEFPDDRNAEAVRRMLGAIDPELAAGYQGFLGAGPYGLAYKVRINDREFAVKIPAAPGYWNPHLQDHGWNALRETRRRVIRDLTMDHKARTLDGIPQIERYYQIDLRTALGQVVKTYAVVTRYEEPASPGIYLEIKKYQKAVARQLTALEMKLKPQGIHLPGFSPSEAWFVPDGSNLSLIETPESKEPGIRLWTGDLIQASDEEDARPVWRGSEAQALDFFVPRISRMLRTLSGVPEGFIPDENLIAEGVLEALRAEGLSSTLTPTRLGQGEEKKSELRAASLNLISYYRGVGRLTRDSLRPILETPQAFAEVLEQTAYQVETAEDAARGVAAWDRFHAILAIDRPLVIDYVITVQDLQRMGNPEPVVRELLKAIRDAVSANANLIVRVHVPDSGLDLDGLFAAVGQNRYDRILKLPLAQGNGISLQNVRLSQPSAAAHSAFLTISSGVVQGDSLLLGSDRYQDRTQVAYQGEQGPQVAARFFSAGLVLAAEALSRKSLQELVQYDTGRFRVQSREALDHLGAYLLDLLGEHRAAMLQAAAA